jgi:ribonuclease R
MAEVEILGLVTRSRDPLLARIILKKWKQYLKVIPEQGNLEVPYMLKNQNHSEDSIVAIQFWINDRVEITSTFGKENDVDLDERLILWLARARTEFGESIIREWNEIKKSNSPHLRSSSTPERTDFRDWYTFTIDGSDAKDLDDAISIRQEKNGDYTLAVHIADVAEYVTEWSALDREAIMRATSIYTPGKVIPMLPEILSNDLCSLHPGTMKLTLSCVMLIDSKGYVKHADIVEGIIESRHRGIYDDIAKRYEAIEWKNWEKTESTELDAILKIAFSLYHVLEKRRRKEGKISFESTEIYFDFGETKSTQSIQKTPLHIKKRERNDAHKLIEEFMVLANEEVAKWCHHHGLPFLSRVHGLPGNEQTEIIQSILRNTAKVPVIEWGNRGELLLIKQKWTPVLEPTHIREFLESIHDPVELYRYSRLLLPKMAKATYSDTPFRHFGLALEYYSHFTSPIRRYPDLQVHRIIKEKIMGKLSNERITHYKTLLKRIARNCSERERSAEDIERAMNSLYICRYMSDKVGKVYNWQISGLSEFALFVELENGIETTLYLPRGRYNINSIEWVLTTPSGKKLWSIWEKIQIKIENVNMTERRVVVGKI